MKISLGGDTATETLLTMKTMSSSNLARKNNYLSQSSGVNQICMIVKWRPGIYLFLSILMLICLVKLYLASLTGETRIDNLDSSVFDQTPFGGHEHNKPVKEIFYGIMIDAGSTGSRVHVYEFHSKANSAAPILAKERFEQIKPGLSSYASNPLKGAESIKSLLDIAKETVPETEWSQTPVALKATAGLRLLPEDQAERLLEEVRILFRQYPFKLPESPVMVMDGTDEGIYGWISANFLLERLGGSDGAQFSVGCIDLGGGSMQITFAPHEVNTTSLANRTFISKVPVFNSMVTLYTHSYLGFGLMSAREVSMSGPDAHNTIQVMTACMPADYNGNWENGPTKYVITGATGIDQTRYEICRTSTDKAVKKRIAHPAEIRHHAFYVFSYFYDRAVDANLIDKERGGILTVQSYVEAAKKFCDDKLFDAARPFLCMDLCILSSYLEVGFMFASDTTLVTRKTIDDKEASWTLGATFFLLNET